MVDREIDVGEASRQLKKDYQQVYKISQKT
jgi:hypothetical protein